MSPKVDFATSKMCYLKKEADQSIPHSTTTLITFPSEVFDPHNWHDDTLNTSRITVDEDGIYEVTAFVRFADASGGSYRFLALSLNGTQISTAVLTKDSDGRSAGSVVLPVAMTSGQYIEMAVNQNSGNAINSRAHSLMVKRVG